MLVMSQTPKIMYLFPLGIIFSIYLVHHLGFRFAGISSSPYYPVEDIAINCGSSANSSAFDGREWVGDHIIINSKFTSSQLKGKSVSSKIVQYQSLSIDPVPYKTVRISRSQFTYTFQLKPGQKFIRLHFYPASYPGFERSKDFFTVRAGRYTLLNNFSPSLNADALGVKYFAKEFCVNVEENQVFNLTFSPSQSSSIFNDAYAFINGIEIVSMPADLYYTPDGDLGAHVVGNKFRLYIDNSTALEMVHRLNVGGRSILSVEDLGEMFRVWSGDKNYLLQSGVLPVTTTTTIKYTTTATYFTPLKVYQTAWSMASNKQTSQWYNFTWKLPVDLGFRYLVRLHFCELQPTITVSGQKEFAMSINNKIIETDADVIKWSGGNGVAVYRDYVVMMEGNWMACKHDLIITLQLKYGSSTENIDAILKGIEIFKLSNADNNLASANPAFTRHAPLFRIPILQKLVLAFGSTNAIATSATLVLILLCSIVYHLNNSESNSSKINISSSSNEELCRRFSFVEIQLATNYFDDALVIGKGGFGNVFKGLIDGGTKIVAIKRLNSRSGQGAREFQAEIDVLSKLRHNHLVSLIGYCNECQEMILVYEYMAYGSLDDCLHRTTRYGNGNSPLPWDERLNICIGAARGLDFLHMSSGAQHGIIHCDVKSSNILLDENWLAKISDFGLSRITSLSCTHISTNVQGTFGYLDPECFKTQRLTKGSDVYAFGVVLFEVLCGRQAVDLTVEEEQHSLALWARKCVRKGTLDQLVDPSVKDQIPPHCLRGFVEIANKCLLEQPNERPTMAEIVARLELIMLEWRGKADSHAEQEVIDFGGTRNESIDWSIPSGDSTPTSWRYSIPPIEEINESRARVVEIISPRTTKYAELQIKKKDYGSHHGPLLGSRLWDSLWHRMRHSKTKAHPLPEVICRRFSEEEIKAATDNFSDDLLIRKGSYRMIYAGFIEKMRKVAISRWNGDEFYDLFFTELQVQSKLQCINIVSLVGYCYDGHEMILVHESMANGSLFDHLHGTSNNNNQRLSWRQRLQICIGAARGLNYLHTGVEQMKFIHRDVKPSNILLDQNWDAKIITTTAVATRGYLDPEYKYTFRFTEKSDVYSFGVVLLEVLCAREASSMDLENEKSFLRTCALHCIDAGTVEEIVDPYLMGKISPHSLNVFAEIAGKCMLEKGIKRPQMTDVVRNLELALQLQEIADAALENELLSQPKKIIVNQQTDVRELKGLMDDRREESTTKSISGTPPQTRRRTKKNAPGPLVPQFP